MADMRFDEDVVVVTGAGRGLGREYALAFAMRGASVVVNDPGMEQDADGQNQSVAQQVVDEINAIGGNAVADLNSVASPEGAAAIVRTALDTFGCVTILVNNAGIISFAPLTDISDEDWRLMQAVTLDGTFYMCRAVWPHMAAQGFGRIVNTTSNAGFAGNETLVAYAAAKMGVAGVTKALAQEVADTGITVNAVAPMAITRMNQEVFFGGSDSAGSPDWRDDIRSGQVPMGPPAIVAPTVLWLAHRTTKQNGAIFSSSSGKVARVGFVIGEGFFDPQHGPEELRHHSANVCRLGDQLEPSSTADELALIPMLYQGPADTDEK